MYCNSCKDNKAFRFEIDTSNAGDEERLDDPEEDVGRGRFKSYFKNSYRRFLRWYYI
jgi:hypothetical protein